MTQTDDFSPSISRQMDDADRDYQQAVANQTFLMVRGLIRSTLYLTAVFTAGLLTGHEHAWQMAIFTMGLCYIAPFVQITFPTQKALAMLLVAASIVAGVIAGLSLLVG